MSLQINSKCLHTLLFADDQVVIANDKDDVQYKKINKSVWKVEITTQRR